MVVVPLYVGSLPDPLKLQYGVQLPVNMHPHNRIPRFSGNGGFFACRGDPWSPADFSSAKSVRHQAKTQIISLREIRKSKIFGGRARLAPTAYATARARQKEQPGSPLSLRGAKRRGNLPVQCLMPISRTIDRRRRLLRPRLAMTGRSLQKSPRFV